MSTFLLVDDSVFMRSILRKIITSDGHTIVGEASNGAQALEEYQRLHPDMVTMDITMNGTDGLEGLRLIKEYDPDAAVVMCTAMGQKCFVVEAVQLGAKEFIVKPFTKEKVLSTIRFLLNSKEKKS